MDIVIRNVACDVVKCGLFLVHLCEPCAIVGSHCKVRVLGELLFFSVQELGGVRELCFGHVFLVSGANVSVFRMC